MYKFAVAVGLLLAPLETVSADVLSEVQQPANSEGPAAQRAFVHGLFSRAGFPPIGEVRAEGREVRRLLLQDSYMILPVPGVELEQLDDKRITLRLQYVGSSSDPIRVDYAAWDALLQQEQDVFGAPEFRPAGARSASTSPPPICHGWIARLEVEYQRTASWAACGGSVTPAYKYAVAIAELAVGSRPDCVFDRTKPFGSFSACFAPTQSLHDPKLEKEFYALRKEYDDAPGADRLADAR